MPGPTLEEKAGELMPVGFDGATAAEATEVSAAIQAELLGAVVLFADGPFNVQSPEQVKALTAGLQALVPAGRPPLIIAADEEGGLVARLNDRFGFPATLSEEYMAANGLTAQYAAQMADTLKAAGVNLNLAPVVDVNVNPDNPIIGALGRSFSSDPEVVAQQAIVFIQAMHAKGVRCTLKHFPGHGSSTVDSHLGFTDVTSTWTDRELIPFRSVIEAGLADAVMTAHIFNSNIDPDYPATLSQKTITGILRGQLGYQGVVITDSITMHAIADFYGTAEGIELAINAGADMISISSGTIGSQPSGDVIRGVIVDAVNAGRIPISRVDEAYARVMALRAKTVA
jgi:beta-N-acetylhexosaminidase